jgi:chemotaxis protein CheD
MNSANNRISNDIVAPELQRDRRKKFYLHPGQVFTSRECHAVTTILGSCVSVCLWDPSAKIGGINHFLLPTRTGDAPASPRFGDLAIRQLIEQLVAFGCRRQNLLAKIFGGACVLEAFQVRESHLGQRNAQVAEQILAAAGIPLAGQDVGGQRGRKLIFHTDDGAAWVKPL